ncbi:MAG: rhodanese-like domain-containing protein [Cyclobacteriaceae bacterium]
MLQFIKSLLIKDTTPGIREMLENGAVVIDVRSEGEYNSGHLSNSVNIPLNKLAGKIDEFDKRKPIITCCASGIRSSSAKKMFKSKGFETVRNGGGWVSLKKYGV